VILSGGGTAGHVYPALALADRLVSTSCEVLYVGTPDSLEERLVRADNVPFASIEVQPLEQDYRIWRGPDRARYATLVTAPLSWIRARRPATRIIERFNPDVVVGFGGYVCAPIVWAAHRAHVPVVLHEQNSVMGKANRQLARDATVVALTFEDTVSQVEGVTDARIVVTGNPVRPALRATSRAQARQALGLADDDVFVLVFGGSRGARSLNEAVAHLARTLLADEHVHIMHATGLRDFDDTVARAGLPSDFTRYRPVAYIDEMDTVMPGADLVVCRAGSTTIAEIGALAIPAILVPFPLATGDHQTKNARTLVEAGSAVLVRDDELGSAVFASTLEGLIADADRRRTMRAHALALSQTDALSALTDVVLEAGDAQNRDRVRHQDARR